MTYKYDPEGDILAVTLNDRPFDYAEEMGDIVMHFDKEHRPVYFEILKAQSFLRKAATELPLKARQEILTSLAAV